LRIGEWVAVDEDYSVGICSEGGAGMVVALSSHNVDVKYILDGRTEHNVCKKRVVIIPIPFRGEKATTRATSTTKKKKEMTSTTKLSVACSNHPFTLMKNALQRLKFGMQTIAGNPSRKHEKVGWMAIELQKAGMWDGDRNHLQRLVMADYQAQLAAVEYGKELMGAAHDPRTYIGKKKKACGGKFVSLKKASQEGIPKNVYTVPYLIYAYGVAETTFKRWRKSARGGVTTKVVEDSVGEVLLPGNVIEDRNVARQYYNGRYFFVQEMMKVAKASTVHWARDRVYAQRVKFGLDYNKKVADGHDMRGYENQAIAHDARWEYVKDDLIGALASYRCMSYRSLAQHIDNWCSKATIERWLKSHETYHFFTKKIKPGVTEENKVKQVEFSEYVHRRWDVVLEPGIIFPTYTYTNNKSVLTSHYNRSKNTMGSKRRKMVAWLGSTLQRKNM
jgi:hypothetical protein